MYGIASTTFVEQNKQLFKLDYEAHHHIDEQFSIDSSIALKHFSLDTQTILSPFYSYLLNSTKEFQGQLRERWQKNKVPTDIIEMLLSFQLIAKPSGVVMLVLTNPKLNIMYFRRRLTEWLNESGKTILDLFPATADEKQKHTVNIIAAVLETGAVNSKEGIIYQPIVKGLNFNFSENISD